MKITFVLPHADLSGGVRVSAIYAQRLSDRGHDVCVVSTPGPRPTWKERLVALLQGKGWLSQVMKSPSHIDAIDIPHHIIQLGRVVTDADVPDADVVIATWWETAEWVTQLSAAKGAKAYFIQHHEVFDYLPQERVRATYKLPLHKITISKWLVGLMQTEYGDDQVTLVPNSVDTAQFHAPQRDRQPVPTVGMLYSRIPWKGCDVSFAAIARARQAIPNLRVVAFGAEEPSDDLPLPEHTNYTRRPAQHSIKDIYASTDVWLCGSYSDGFHLPLLEAMACRCPVVSTEVGGPVDLIKQGENGYLVPIGDAAALGDRLVQLLKTSEAEWQAMSDAAYRTAVQYTWDDATDLFEAGLYRAIERSQKGDWSPKPPVAVVQDIR